MHARGQGSRTAEALRTARLEGCSAAGLTEAARHLGRRRALVLLASDFHFPADFARAVLASFARHYVVPIVVWDADEVATPARRGWIEAADSESGARRFLWLRPAFAERVRTAVAARRELLTALFRSLGLRPLYLEARFDPALLTRHFLGGGDAG
jgi:hypothetical protein